MTNALSTPAQRHVVRVEPPGHAPVYLMAVQNGGYSDVRAGLLWYRSDDLGATWRYYRDAIAAPDPAVVDTSLRPSTLHLTADLIVVGNDVAAVYSYDTTGSGFPADAWDPKRAVHFQWWRFDGADDWVPDARIRVATPGPGQAYRRAELARDGAGRIWVQSFLRRSSCSPVGSTSCVGDLLQVWVSTDGGSTFQGPQNLAELPHQMGGGRLIHVGGQLLMLWADHSSAPAQLMRRSDSDPLTQWSARTTAFPDGTKIYHGAALSAAPDGAGGLHLVSKRWVASPDVHQLYYRHFDGANFGPAKALGGAGDWATQPAITATDDDLYVCVNHLVSTSAHYEIRSYRLSTGFSTWEVLDARVDGKGYPAAPERVPSRDGVIPCAFGMGPQTGWGAGHTVQVALQAAGGGPAPAPAAVPTFLPAPGTFTSAQQVTLSSTTPGATIFYTTDGTTPTVSSTRYTVPVAVSATTTLRAFASADGFSSSAVATGTFTIQAPAPDVLFADEFTTTTGLGAAWRTWRGSFSTDGASAVSVSTDDNWASVAVPLGTSDHAVEATLSIPPGALYSGVVARSSGGTSFTRDLYAAQISSKGTVNLYRRNAWTWTLLRSASAGVQTGRPHALRLVTTGTSPVHLEVWLDGARLLAYDDVSSDRLASGLVGMVNYDAGVAYESFRVVGR